MRFFKIFKRKSQKESQRRKETLFNKIKELLVKEAGIKQESIRPTSRFKEDLGLDSTEAVEFIMVLEEEFGLEIPDEDAERIKTVGEAADYLAVRLQLQQRNRK